MNSNDSLSNLTSVLDRLARAATQAEHATTKFQKSLDGASNKAIDKVTEAMIELLKQSDLLTKQQKDSIKNVKGVTEALKAIANAGDKISEIQKKYEENIAAAAANKKKEKAAANEAIKELRKLGISASGGPDSVAENLKKLAEEVTNTMKAVETANKSLNSASARIGRGFDDQKKKLLDSIEELGKFSTAAKLTKEALQKTYESLTAHADRGLLAAMVTINTEAIAMRMGVADFIKLIEQNRDTITALGGGVAGIEKFASQIKNASAGLEYMGAEGKKVAAGLLSTFNRAGVGTDAYAKNAKKVNDQFRVFQGAFGTTAEEFSEYYQSLLDNQQLQSRIIMGDKEGVRLMTEELIERTKHLQVLGLTTKQMTELNKRVENLFDPKKNEQQRAVDEYLKTMGGFMSMARSLRQSGNTEDADLIENAYRSGQLQKFIKGVQDDDASVMTPENMKLAQLLARNPQYTKLLNTKGGWGVAGFQNALSRELLNNPTASAIAAIGDAGNKAKIRGTVQTGDKLSNIIAASGGKLNEKGEIENTLMTESFIAARNAVDQASALMKNEFVPALEAATSILLLFTGGKLISAAASLAARAGVGAAAGLLGGGALSALGVTAAGLGGGYILGKAIGADKLGSSIGTNMADRADARRGINLSGSVSIKQSAVANKPTPEMLKDLAETDRMLGLPIGFSAAQMAVESGFRSDAESPKGAKGYAQVMPKTLAGVEKIYNNGNKLDPTNWKDAVFIQRSLMRENLQRYKGNLEDAARGYNAGRPDRRNNWWDNKETNEYLPKIRGNIGFYRQEIEKLETPTAANTELVNIPKEQRIDQPQGSSSENRQNSVPRYSPRIQVNPRTALALEPT